MARRQMKYTVETYCLEPATTHDGEIVRLGSRDKYKFESYGDSGFPVLYIFRFSDGRTINEYKFYELKIIDLPNCNYSDDIIMQSDDIILGISQTNACFTPTLHIFRPYYARGASQTLTSDDPCGS